MSLPKPVLRWLIPTLLCLLVTTFACVWLAYFRTTYEASRATDFGGMRSQQAGRTVRFDPLKLIELNLYDWRVHLSMRRSRPETNALGLIAIQDLTIERLRRGFPLGEPYGLLFERSLYGRVLRELNAQGAAAVAFDIILAENRPDHRPFAVSETEAIASDEFFAAQLRTNPAAILACAMDSPPAPVFRQTGVTLGAVDRTVDGDGVTRRVPACLEHTLISVPVQRFADRRGLEVKLAAGNVLHFVDHVEVTTNSLPINTNGIVVIGLGKDPSDLSKGRIELPAIRHQRVWNMGILMAARKLALDLEAAEFQPGRIVIPRADGPALRVPIDRSTNLLINWNTTVFQVPVANFENILAADLFRQDSEPGAELPAPWRDKLLLVGSLATGNNLTDIGATPLNTKDNLVGIYLNIANSLLTQRFVTRLPLAMECLLVALLGVAGALLTGRLDTGLAVASVLVAGGVFGVLAVWAFLSSRLWIPIAHPLFAGLLLNHAAMLAYRTIFEQRERQRVRSVFSKVVSPNVVQELLKTEHFNQLSGSRRNLTVFFADVRGFTEMTDRVQFEAEDHVREHRLEAAAADAYFAERSKEVLDTVNLYLATIAEVIMRHYGTLDKYIGDCVMAFWGAPTANIHHAVDAVLAAIDAQRAIHRLNTARGEENQRRHTDNKARTTRGEDPLPLLTLLQLGTGINTGTVTVGLMGSDAHGVNYTVFGREVNLASRLEGVSGRSRIIIGEGTYRELAAQAPALAKLCHALEPVTVKGFRNAVPVYEVDWRGEEDTTVLSRMVRAGSGK